MVGMVTGEASVEAQVELAEDFQTWWTGTMWSWKPSATENPIATLSSVLATPKSELPDLDENEDRTSSSDEWAPETVPASESTPSENLTLSLDDRNPLHVVPPYFEIRRSPKRGYGAFALKDIPPYTTILSEPALLQAVNANFAEKFTALSPEKRACFLSLACHRPLNPDMPLATFKTNRFVTSDSNDGIFLIASRFNHKCRPSVDYTYNKITSKLVLTTKTFISKDQEITISYGQDAYNLYYKYGFFCDCGDCSPINERHQIVEKWELERAAERKFIKDFKDQLEI